MSTLVQDSIEQHRIITFSIELINMEPLVVDLPETHENALSKGLFHAFYPWHGLLIHPFCTVHILC